MYVFIKDIFYNFSAWTPQKDRFSNKHIFKFHIFSLTHLIRIGIKQGISFAQQQLDIISDNDLVMPQTN
jgi:hypothetical protein